MIMQTYDYRKNPNPLNVNDQSSIHMNKCCYCEKENLIVLDSESFELWKTGDFIQEAFPYLDASKRELIQTGTHPECWNDMFESDDE